MRTRGTDNWEAGAVKAYTGLKRNGGREGAGWGPPPYSRIHLSNLRWIIVFIDRAADPTLEHLLPILIKTTDV